MSNLVKSEIGDKELSGKLTTILLMLILIIMIGFTYLLSISKVYAQDDGTVNFTALPDKLLERLLLPNLFVSKVLASIIVIMIIMIPFAIFGKFLLSVLVFHISLFFCTAIGWLDGWIILVVCFLTAGLFTFGFISRMFKG